MLITSIKLIEISCEDKWDWEKVGKASNAIATYINKNNDIELIKMLKGAGLSNCKFIEEE